MAGLPAACCLERYSLGSEALLPLDPAPIPVSRRFTLIALLLLLSTTACRRDPVFREMSDSTYIRTMVALRRLPIGAVDTVSRARQRDSVLRVYGVTAAQLESVAVRLAEDPARAAVIFRAIENPTVSSPP